MPDRTLTLTLELGENVPEVLVLSAFESNTVHKFKDVLSHVPSPHHIMFHCGDAWLEHIGGF